MSMTPETILRLADMSDGWSILCPDRLRDCGLPDDLIEALAACHESDPRDSRGSIYSGDRLLAQAFGVYSLDLLNRLAALVDADLSGVVALGRGTQAEQYKAAIREALGEIRIEYHYEMDRWFLGRLADNCYFDFSAVDGLDDPNELTGDDLSGSWPEGLSNFKIADWLCVQSETCEKLPVIVRGSRYVAAGFNGFFCGYDMIRFFLTPVLSLESKGGNYE